MDRAKTLACVIPIALLVSCSNSRKPPIVVGSKNFTEQVLLGEVTAQQIERRLGQMVDRRLNLGGTLLAHQALILGDISMCPEYTGTASTNILKLPPDQNPEVVLNRVRDEYSTRWKLVWLNPLGFDNSFAMAIRGPESRANKLETMSDAVRYRKDWVLGAGYEFASRPDGLPALMRTYALGLRGGTPKTMDLGLLYKALEDKQVDMIAANVTDGMLSVQDLTVLKDDKRAFPPYQAALVVRSDIMTAYPALRTALGELSGKISAETMRKLNYQVDGNHRPVSAVAAEFLRTIKP
jgi:glycine betaine/choline ABC-type transport system substrate-binding protein